MSTNMLLDNKRYLQSLRENAERFTAWDRLAGKTLLITGATGLVCSYLTDMILQYSTEQQLNIRIVAAGRSEERTKERFYPWLNQGVMGFAYADLGEEFSITDRADYIIHGASNASPQLYDSDPVGTMKANIYGTDRLLKYGVEHEIERFLFLSSGEIYGEREISTGVDEAFCGYTDYMNARSCYPVSKMAAETLCASYAKQYGIHTGVARLCHVYGPTMAEKDHRVIHEFLRNVLASQDIVMKSNGSKVRSYCYVADAAVALLYILCCGNSAEAYNVSYRESVLSIREIAECAAECGSVKVVMDCQETAGATSIEKSILNHEKLSQLGWSGAYNMQRGLRESINILREEK